MSYQNMPTTASSASEGLRGPLPAGMGITNGVKALIVLGMLCSIMQGVFVGVLASPFGRVWPAAASTTIELPPYNPNGP